MKALNCYNNMVSTVLLGIFLALSFGNDASVLTDSIRLGILNNEGVVIDDSFTPKNDNNVNNTFLSNDEFFENGTLNNINVSDSNYGFIVIDEEQTSVTYTVQNCQKNTLGINHKNKASFQLDTVKVAARTATLNEGSTQPKNTDSSSTDSFAVKEDTTIPNEKSHSARLLFSSGFEGVSLSAQHDDYRYVQGTDSDTGFSWPPKILGSTGTEQEPSGIHTINDRGTSIIKNRLERVVGHDGKPTIALFQGIEGTAGVTQTPYQINNIKENPNELYITYWMKIDNTSLSGVQKWRVLWEYKTDDYGDGDGFRMIAFINTDNNGNTYWSFQGDRNPSDAVWEKPNFDIPVPREEWFKVEYYFKWSEGSDGRAFMKVNDQLVGEHHGATTANSKDLDFIILTQVYGDTSPMHQWVDDIEIWDGLPY